MISGWSKLQLPLGPENLGRGAFSSLAPSMASRSSFTEHGFYLCRSYGDRAGFDSFSFPELKATLVENLIEALINATEILDVYAHPTRDPFAVKQFLGLETSGQDHDFALGSQLLPQSDSLEFPFHERLSYERSAHCLTSPSSDDVISMQLHSQQQGHADHTVWSSSALHVVGLTKQKISVNSVHPAEHRHVNTYNLNSEEDLLLQEARSKAFRSPMEPDKMKDASRAEILGNGLVGASSSGSKQARSISYELAKTNSVFAETEKAFSFAELLGPSQQNSLLWGSIALGILLTGALIMTWRSIFFNGRQSQRPSVKRRILKSQWYGNPGSPLWEHKSFQMKVSEFSKYSLLEVDGDRKLLRVPTDHARVSAAFAKRESRPLIRAQAPQQQPIRQPIPNMEIGHGSSTSKAQGQPIRQTIHSSKPLFRKQHGSMRSQQDKISNGAASAKQLPETVIGLRNSPDRERGTVVFQPRGLGLHVTRAQTGAQDADSNHRFSRVNASKSRGNQGQWGKDDELDLDRRIQKLYQTIQSVEEHRRQAMIALEEERQRSLALEQEMSKQREAGALLGEEVRLLKESHNALLTSLQKKYSTSAAARTAADLVYQDWERRVAVE